MKQVGQELTSGIGGIGGIGGLGGLGGLGSRRAKGWLTLALASISAIASAPLSAVAQDAAGDDAAKNEARTKVQAGVKQLTDKNYPAALAEFEAAFKLYPSTKILLNVATTLNLLERKADAANAYQRYIEAPDADAAKVAEVTQVLATLDGQVTKLFIEVTPGGVDVKVNDKDSEVVETSKAIRVEPGAYKVFVSKTGYEPVTLEGNGEAGLTMPIKVTLKESSGAPTTRVPSAPNSPSVKGPAPWGVLLRTHVDPITFGAAGLLGGFYEIADRVTLQAAGMAGPKFKTFGFYAGAQVAVLPGKFRPIVAVGVPVFFADGAQVSGRAAVGLDYRLHRHVAVVIEVGGEYLFKADDAHRSFSLVPSLGVNGRL